MAVKSKPFFLEWRGDTTEPVEINKRLSDLVYRINTMLDTLFQGVTAVEGSVEDSADTPAASIALPDTDASHTLALVVGSDLTANRTLTITPGDASRTLTLAGDATISGTNTGDQTTFSAANLTGPTMAAAVTASSLTSFGAAADFKTTSSNFGFSTGAGGTVTQGAGKTTAVTLNKVCGVITTDNASINADEEKTFTLNNSTISAGDVLILNHDVSGTVTQKYVVSGYVTGAGTADITIRNVHTASASEVLTIRFAVIKAVAS